MRLQAVIFDVDGTLAETEELHRHAFNAAFTAAGLAWHWTPSLYAQLLGVTGGKERVLHFIRTTSGAGALSEIEIATLHAAKNRNYAASLVAGMLPLRPGVRRLLAEARQAGLRLAIATTTSRENVDALLSSSTGTAIFDVIAAGDQVPTKKPAPDIYRLAMEQLGLEREDCLAIEDSINGLHSALAAGLSCIVTQSAYGGSGPFPGALSVLTSLGDPGTDAALLAGLPLEGPLVDVEELRLWHKHAAGLRGAASPLPQSPTPNCQ